MFALVLDAGQGRGSAPRSGARRALPAAANCFETAGVALSLKEYN